MKGRTWLIFLLISIALVFFYVTRERAEKQRRDELRLLDSIKTAVWLNLEAGGQLPTNWLNLSNSVNWSFVSSSYGFNHLHLPQEIYTFLPRSVTNEETGGFCFVLSSKPTKRYGGSVGRWALIVGPTLQPEDTGAETTNAIITTWLPEDSLKPEIRSQLTNEP